MQMPSFDSMGIAVREVPIDKVAFIWREPDFGRIFVLRKLFPDGVKDVCDIDSFNPRPPVQNQWCLGQ